MVLLQWMELLFLKRIMKQGSRLSVIYPEGKAEAGSQPKGWPGTWGSSGPLAALARTLGVIVGVVGGWWLSR